MNPRRLLLPVLALCPALSPLQAAEADMTIACQSLRVSDGTFHAGSGFSYLISYTTDVDNDGFLASINEEWFPFAGTSGYFTFFYLKETLLEEAEWVGSLELTIPESDDANLNFLVDFFEVDRAVAATTGGEVQVGNQVRPATLVWSRAAGETYGTVQVSFSVPQAGIPAVTFEHPFEIYQFRGKLTYQPPAADGAITASVDLKRVGSDGSYAGPFPLKRNSSVELERLNTKWIGPTAEEFEVLGSREVDGVELFLDKLPQRPHYVGSLFYLDGIPSTPFQEEYDLWDVFIEDKNDADQDGIPDLSDTAGGVPTVPTLGVALTEGFLKLTITGQAGQTVTVERKPTLDTAAWAEVETVTLTGPTKELTLPLSGDSSDFYRAR